MDHTALAIVVIIFTSGFLLGYSVRAMVSAARRSRRHHHWFQN